MHPILKQEYQVIRSIFLKHAVHWSSSKVPPFTWRILYMEIQKGSPQARIPKNRLIKWACFSVTGPLWQAHGCSQYRGSVLCRPRPLLLLLNVGSADKQGLLWSSITNNEPLLSWAGPCPEHSVVRWIRVRELPSGFTRCISVSPDMQKLEMWGERLKARCRMSDLFFAFVLLPKTNLVLGKAVSF